MARRTTTITLVFLFTLLLVLAFTPMALASSWSDVPDSALASYGVTDGQVRAIAGGYDDGTFRPWQNITRAQFVKMANATFGLAPLTPASATFTDVPPSHFYWKEIEAASAAGLVNGVGGGLFAPERNLSREQAIAIIARRVASEANFDLGSLSEAEISVTLGAFADGPLVSTPLRDEMAYALTKGITKGNAQGNLAPQSQISRLAAAVLLVRAGDGAPAPAVPTVTGLSPADGLVEGGTGITITGTGFTGATGVSFGGTAATAYTVVSDTQMIVVAPATSLAAGKPSKTVDVRVVNTAGTSNNTAADDYVYYTLTVVNGSNVQTYSLSDLREREPVSGYWGAHREPEVVNHYIGTSLFDLLGDVGGIPEGKGLRITASDGFTVDYEAERLAAMGDGTYQMWDYGASLDTWSDDIETTGSVTPVVAYQMDGSALPAGIGPIRVVLLQDNERMVTEGKYSPRLVTRIEVR